MLTETFLTYGQPAPPVELVPLRAGPLTMLYDPTIGMVRHIKLGELEVLRGIYAAVRDRNWGTVPGVVRETGRESKAESFRLEFESEHRQDEIYFSWRGLLCGAADGTLRYEFAGEAKSTFLRNRIGFCVLHPIHECAGAAAQQLRIDGSEVACRFPQLIEPQIVGRSSFQQLRGLAHEVTPEVWAEVKFEGDTFELEDQRNWTDASFKTYCTPLTLPFPVEIQRGGRICQAVTLRLAGKVPEFSAAHIERGSAQAEVVTLNLPDSPTHRLPRVGLGVASHREPLTEQEVDRLRRLGLSHLRVDVRLAAANWQSVMDQAAVEAGRLEVPLELALHLPPQGEPGVAQVTSALERHAALLLRVLALREGEVATTPETMERARRLLGGIAAPVGAGSDCNFCELNREHALGRLALKEADFLFWSINPQVHAIDHLSVMETLEAQMATVRSAQALADHRPLVVTPVTLKQRFNPVATGSEPGPPPGELPPQIDPRQLSLFGAAWTLGSIAALAHAGAESVSFYETTGWRGVMERAAGSPLPNKFPSVPGGVFPLFDVLAGISGFDQMGLMEVPLPTQLTALALFESNNTLRRVILASMVPREQTVRIVGLSGSMRLQIANAARTREAILAHDETTALDEAPCQIVSGVLEMELPSYAVARLDPVS